YAVISSGGLAGIHETLRLVPFKALERDTARKGDFMISLRQAEWQASTPLKEAEFKSNRITISDEARRRLAQQFERAKSGEAATGSAYYTANNSLSLIRASQIRGKDVHAGGKSIGGIQAVLVDEKSGKATALFQPEA